MNPDTPAEYRDRKTGLVVFGILEIGLGGAAWFLALLTAVSIGMAPANAGMAAPPRAMVPAIAVYWLVGIVFIGLGIGSVMGRRWARALWVCLAGTGLVTSLVALPTMGYLAVVELPRNLAAAGQPALPPAALWVAQAVLVLFGVLFYLVIPGAIFLFYRSPHVKRTCERLDPQERWTDRCPLPVLALSLLTGVGAFWLPVFLLGMQMPFPLLGRFGGGTPGMVAVVALSAVLLYVSLGLYRLRRIAWWLLLALVALMGVSAYLMFWHTDLRTVYAQMGFDPALADRSADLVQRMKWAGLVALLPWLTWVLYVRRYFRPGQAEGAETAD